MARVYGSVRTFARRIERWLRDDREDHGTVQAVDSAYPSPDEVSNRARRRPRNARTSAASEAGSRWGEANRCWGLRPRGRRRNGSRTPPDRLHVCILSGVQDHDTVAAA
jgi:hypothetical protein